MFKLHDEINHVTPVVPLGTPPETMPCLCARVDVERWRALVVEWTTGFVPTSERTHAPLYHVNDVGTVKDLLYISLADHGLID